jgi:hypothetical protein
MKNTRLLVVLACCLVTGSTSASAAFFDGFTVDFGGGNTFVFNAADDFQQSITATLAGVPTNFIGATIFMTEPANELPCAVSFSCIVATSGPLAGIPNLSDALTIMASPAAGVAIISFVSDGASQAALANFPVLTRTFSILEDGTLQNVGTDFGLAATAVQVGSDVAGPEVPEPGTGLLLLGGLLIAAPRVGSLSARAVRWKG